MTAVGTIAWMAPEVGGTKHGVNSLFLFYYMFVLFCAYIPQILCREKVSKSCDVYSYVVLLFEIATQQLPFSYVLSFMVPAMIAEGKLIRKGADSDCRYCPHKCYGANCSSNTEQLPS